MPDFNIIFRTLRQEALDPIAVLIRKQHLAWFTEIMCRAISDAVDNIVVSQNESLGHFQENLRANDAQLPGVVPENMIPALKINVAKTYKSILITRLRTTAVAMKDKLRAEVDQMLLQPHRGDGSAREEQALLF